MSIDFIFRLIGMVVFSVIGVFWGINFSKGVVHSPARFSIHNHPDQFHNGIWLVH